MQSALFILEEEALALHQLIKVDFVSVEIGPIHAGEFHPAAHGNAAAAAHSGAVDHDGIEADHGLDAGRPGDLGAGLHHYRGTDGEDLVDVGMAAQRLGEAVGHEALEAGGAVVGAEDQLIAILAEFLLPEDKRLRAKADDADDVAAVLLEGAQLREDRGDAQAAADADDLSPEANVRGATHGAGEAEERGALEARRLHFPGGLSDGLDHEGDGPLLAVKIGDGERDSLAAFMGEDDDELARPGRPRHERVANFEQIGRLGEILAGDDQEWRRVRRRRGAKTILAATRGSIRAGLRPGWRRLDKWFRSHC